VDAAGAVHVGERFAEPLGLVSSGVSDGFGLAIGLRVLEAGLVRRDRAGLLPLNVRKILRKLAVEISALTLPIAEQLLNLFAD
jgi:hypothetical protein